MNWSNPDGCCTTCSCGRVCCESKGTADCGHANEATCPDCCAAWHRRCGRLDAHEAHDWTRPKYANAWCSVVPAATYHCPGEVVIEGGYLELMA